MGFVANFVFFRAVKQFVRTVKIWPSYSKLNLALFWNEIIIIHLLQRYIKISNNSRIEFNVPLHDGAVYLLTEGRQLRGDGGDTSPNILVGGAALRRIPHLKQQ